ncbi:15-hydroxyprostaglandin dehydrogenase [Trichonephila clavipes]|nr:15-hydroxyprostaglandin dehydrogenase [Trichonephila clavipes]
MKDAKAGGSCLVKGVKRHKYWATSIERCNTSSCITCRHINLKQPTLNHAQSDTMQSVVLADLTCALQGTNRGNRSAMEESENDVGSLDQLLLYSDEHYLAGKLPRETI